MSISGAMRDSNGIREDSMESVKNYTKNFFKDHKKNMRFAMSTKELICAVAESRAKDTIGVIYDVFNFGYAKGYRAALSEMQKRR